MNAEDPDVKIKGCTVLLEPGKSPPELLFTFLLSRADGCMMKQEYDQALADIERARTDSPDSPGAYSARAQVYIQLNEFTLALVYINKAIELTKPPFDEDAAADFYTRGWISDQMGDKQSALADYQ
jgi:tetratricopeptide (TPR) repeat protein